MGGRHGMTNFWSDTRAAATALTAVVITIMTLGAGAVVTDHVALVNNRDTLNAAAGAASIAAAQHMATLPPDTSDEALVPLLKDTARAYILGNLLHLPPDRYKTARDSMQIGIEPDRDNGTVSITVTADLGGAPVSRNIPLFDSAAARAHSKGSGGVKCEGIALELVLALDVSRSMNRTDFGGERRITLAVDAARMLLSRLHEDACEGMEPATGFVPWAGVVRIEDPARWQRELLVDMTEYTGSDAWAGCFADPSRLDTAWRRPRAKDNDGCDLSAILPLSTDATRMDGELAAMRPGLPTVSATKAHLGMTWAQRVLASDWGRAWDSGTHPAAADGEGATKAIVMLTDGRNVAPGSGLSRADLHDLFIESCRGARASGIEVYTVSLLPPGDKAAKKIGQVLLECVGGMTAQTMAANDQDSLNAAFTQIAERLYSLRRTH